MSTIIQIIPAQPGWTAAFIDEGENGAESGFHTEPILCWALIEKTTGERRVVALFDFNGEIDEPTEEFRPLGHYPSEVAAGIDARHHLAAVARLDARDAARVLGAHT